MKARTEPSFYHNAMKIARLNTREPEIFYSLQGEGARIGTPAVFLRLAGCNLACQWCDTKHSWGQGLEMPVADVAARILACGCPNLVITGGEPLLQQQELSALLALLPPGMFTEVESNGTLTPCPALKERVNQWNISPKLAHSGNETTQVLRSDVLSHFAALPHAWFKFVVQGAGDWEAIAALNLPRERIILMPCATTRAGLEAARPAVAELCIRNGVRFGDRLHLALWDDRKGV